jgi:hypothetical protein
MDFLHFASGLKYFWSHGYTCSNVFLVFFFRSKRMTCMSCTFTVSLCLSDHSLKDSFVLCHRQSLRKFCSYTVCLNSWPCEFQVLNFTVVIRFGEIVWVTSVNRVEHKRTPYLQWQQFHSGALYELLHSTVFLLLLAAHVFASGFDNFVCDLNYVIVRRSTTLPVFQSTYIQPTFITLSLAIDWESEGGGNSVSCQHDSL